VFGRYFRFSLSVRDLEELMAERGLSLDHATIWRWTHVYGPEVYCRLRGNVKRKSSTWHVDETIVRIASCGVATLPASDPLRRPLIY
jgi:transposase-like protein